ncbi:MAG TPA: S8 family serine peptidase, partial [Gemmatimonadales bacterium]|nr:S8 family serine peptidase [Gemmatimonadales bacterium]
MNWKVAVAGVVVFGGLACREATQPEQSASVAKSNAVPGEYIVVFRPTVTNPAALAAQLVRLQGGTLRFTYTSALRGFAAKLPAAAAAALAHNPNVAYVEPDQVYGIDVTQSMDGNGDPWGLDRIDQQALPLSATYDYTATGAGVNVYIIDTGIWTAHPDFDGRADNVYDALTFNLLGGVSGEDCNGHGTHVAGTIGGTTYGVAKGVSLHGVRVLSC